MRRTGVANPHPFCAKIVLSTGLYATLSTYSRVLGLPNIQAAPSSLREMVLCVFLPLTSGEENSATAEGQRNEGRIFSLINLAFL